MCQVVGEGEDKEQSAGNVGKHRVRENRQVRTDASGKETEEESCENKHEKQDNEMEGSQEQIDMRLTLHH